MGHDWRPEEWREMDASAVANCLESNDARCCVEGQEWIRLVPTAVLAKALCDVDLHHQYAVCYEAARRLEALEADKVTLRGLVEELHDEDPCSYDHHGYCQTHSLGKFPCPHTRARAALGEEP
jgi:hypothetical protein